MVNVHDLLGVVKFIFMERFKQRAIVLLVPCAKRGCYLAALPIRMSSVSRMRTHTAE